MDEWERRADQEPVEACRGLFKRRSTGDGFGGVASVGPRVRCRNTPVDDESNTISKPLHCQVTAVARDRYDLADIGFVDDVYEVLHHLAKQLVQHLRQVRLHPLVPAIGENESSKTIIFHAHLLPGSRRPRVAARNGA